MFASLEDPCKKSKTNSEFRLDSGGSFLENRP